MQIFIPFTKIQDATLIALKDYETTKVELQGDFGYSRYFKDRFNKGESFINIEQDVVPWPGAIASLMSCDKKWCVFDYVVSNWESQQTPLNSVHLGCAKISSEMIKELSNIWDEDILWDRCDVHLFREARDKGIFPHQHFPGVINANPVFLKGLL